ncbi:MAG: hypothetical protein SVU94_08095 [Bacteroidota bacterium]|nr:hypothetical protein [Bacteroidota bacterium]
MINWKFRQKAEGEVKEDPIQGRFFTTSDVGNITTALIRESIQNSLDARIDKTNVPTIVRFVLNNNGLKPDEYQIYFNDLTAHLKSDDSGLDDLPNFYQPMPYLVVEDYNTTGLEGDLFEDSDPIKSDLNKHNFYWFWRNVARSGKGANDIGRWGVGKTVYSASSIINTFFGLTVRKEDSKKYLMGKSVLKWHKLEDNTNWFCPYGFYAKYEDKEKYFAIPFNSDEDYSVIKTFEETFNINRNCDDYGLSVLIPFPKQEICEESIIKSVIEQYFYPIIEGKLVVKVKTNNQDEIIINSDTIGKIIDKVDYELLSSGKNLKKIFELVTKSIIIDEKEYIKFLIPPLDKAPRWQDTWLYDDKIFKKITDSIFNFENGEIIPFKIPLKVEEKNKAPEICWYKVFVQYDGFLNETDAYFIRDGVTITGIKTIKKKGFRILVVIDDPNMARMFGDSENPAHTEFQKDSPHFLNKYIHGAECISFITNTVSNLYKLLMQPSQGTDEEILKDIFYLDIETAPEKNVTKPKDKNGEEHESINIPDIETPIKPYILKKVEGGIQIDDNPRSEVIPNNILIQLAYILPKGNPLKKYHEWDFNLADSIIKIETEGINILSVNKNKLEVQAKEKPFKIKISGFDNERDIFVKIK